MTYTVGNSSKKLADKKWRWCLEVRGDTEDIAHCIIHLHPTFKDPIRELGEDLSFTGEGWGVFPVKVSVSSPFHRSPRVAHV